MSLMRKVEALRPPVPSFNNSSDFESVSKLIDNYSVILKANGEAIDELCAIADSLHIEHNNIVEDFTTTNEASTNTNGGPGGLEGHESLNSDVLKDTLLSEIDDLNVQVDLHKDKNALTMKLLDICVTSMDQCASGLRDIAYQRSMETLEVHKKYLPLIEAKQDEYMDLLNKYNETENEVFKLSRNISQALKSMSSYHLHSVEQYYES